MQTGAVCRRALYTHRRNLTKDRETLMTEQAENKNNHNSVVKEDQKKTTGKVNIGNTKPSKTNQMLNNNI